MYIKPCFSTVKNRLVYTAYNICSQSVILLGPVHMTMTLGQSSKDFSLFWPCPYFLETGSREDSVSLRLDVDSESSTF